MKKTINSKTLNQLVEQRVQQILNEGMFDKYMDDAQEKLLGELVLVAENDGDSYRNNKNALEAVEKAFKQHLSSTMQSMKHDYKKIAHNAIMEVTKKWSGDTEEDDSIAPEEQPHFNAGFGNGVAPGYYPQFN